MDAELIGLTQTAQSIEGGSPLILPAAASRAIPAGDAKPLNTGPGETDESAHIDQSSTNPNPLYAVENPKSTKLTDPRARRSSASTASTSRTAPGRCRSRTASSRTRRGCHTADKNSRQIFETTALATKGAQAGTYYGSVRWGWRTDAAGAYTKLPLEKVARGDPVLDVPEVGGDLEHRQGRGRRGQRQAPGAGGQEDQRPGDAHAAGPDGAARASGRHARACRDHDGDACADRARSRVIDGPNNGTRRGRLVRVGQSCRRTDLTPRLAAAGSSCAATTPARRKPCGRRRAPRGAGGDRRRRDQAEPARTRCWPPRCCGAARPTSSPEARGSVRSTRGR